jgi:hypothetical protein
LARETNLDFFQGEDDSNSGLLDECSNEETNNQLEAAAIASLADQFTPE